MGRVGGAQICPGEAPPAVSPTSLRRSPPAPPVCTAPYGWCKAERRPRRFLPTKLPSFSCGVGRWGRGRGRMMNSRSYEDF